MSQGNDAFSSKDAETAAVRDATSPESTDADASKDDASVTSSKPSHGKAKSDEAERASDSGKDSARGERDEAEDEDEDRDEGEPAKDDARKREAKEPQRNRRRGGGSRRSARDEDEDDQQEPPQTEEALDVPKMQTVYMLAAMSALTIVCWFAAKLTCNVHPDLVRDPKHFSTKDLAADPKNAAFEFHHKYETGDFTTALDLSTGEMRSVVETKLKECEQDPDPCAKNLARLAGTIQSSGKVLDRKGDHATVELVSVSQSWPGQKSFSFEVTKDGEFWRVASRREVPTRATAPATSAAVVGVAASAAAPSAQPAQVMESPDQPAEASSP